MGIVRLRRRWDPILKEMVDVPVDSGPRNARVHIWADLPDYESPVSGKVISGRKQRREDFKRTRTRPYEGFAAEKKEADRIQAHNEQKLDHLAEKMATEAWAQAPDRIRKAFRNR